MNNSDTHKTSLLKKHYILTTVVICLLISFTVIGCTHLLYSSANNNQPNTNTIISTSANETQNITETQNVTEIQTEAPIPQPAVTIDLMMIGDMLMHESAMASGLMSDNTYNYDHLFKNISDDLAKSDIKIVNQETILGGTQLGLSAYPRFNSPHELGTSEVKAGFNVILHATNHTLDKGLTGLNNCLNFWKTNYPDTAVLGINSNMEEYNNIYVYEKDGFKIAILNYTYGTNGITIPETAPYCVNILEEEKVISDITRAHKVADMIVVCPHWGTEYNHEPDSRQKEWTELFLENGVDVVIGTHPHVVQPVQTFSRKDGHQMVVYYSLGNFVSNQHKLPRMVGGMAKVQLVKNTDGSCYIDHYSYTPIITHILYGPGQITSYKLCDYTQELALQNQIRAKEECSEFSLSYCKNLCKSVLGKDYDTENDMLFVQLKEHTESQSNSLVIK